MGFRSLHTYSLFSLCRQYFSKLASLDCLRKKRNPKKKTLTTSTPKSSQYTTKPQTPDPQRPPAPWKPQLHARSSHVQRTRAGSDRVVDCEGGPVP